MNKIAIYYLTYMPLIFGILLLMLSGKFFLKSYQIKSKYNKAQGIAVSNIHIGKSPLYHSIVEFTTENGEAITFTSKEASNPATYGVGETVPVLYDKNSPKEARIYDWSSLWSTPVLLSFWGIIVSLMGVLAIRLVFEKPQKAFDYFMKGNKYPIEIILPLSIGIVCLVISFFLYINVKKELSNSIKTNAVVLEYASNPRIGFKTQNGINIEFHSPVSSRPPRYQKGEIIEVYYDKDYPDKVRINSFMDLWLLTAFLEGFGGIWFLVGVFYWKVRKKWTASS